MAYTWSTICSLIMTCPCWHLPMHCTAKMHALWPSSSRLSTVENTDYFRSHCRARLHIHHQWIYSFFLIQLTIVQNCGAHLLNGRVCKHAGPTHTQPSSTHVARIWSFFSFPLRICVLERVPMNILPTIYLFCRLSACQSSFHAVCDTFNPYITQQLYITLECGTENSCIPLQTKCGIFQ